jgi:hypothetical protein
MNLPSFQLQSRWVAVGPATGQNRGQDPNLRSRRVPGYPTITITITKNKIIITIIKNKNQKKNFLMIAHFHSFFNDEQFAVFG